MGAHPREQQHAHPCLAACPTSCGGRRGRNGQVAGRGWKVAAVGPAPTALLGLADHRVVMAWASLLILLLLLVFGELGSRRCGAVSWDWPGTLSEPGFSTQPVR